MFAPSICVHVKNGLVPTMDAMLILKKMGNNSSSKVIGIGSIKTRIFDDVTKH